MDCDILREVNQAMDFDDLAKKYWRDTRHPFGGGLEITSKCNYSCVHCYINCDKHEPQLSTEEIKLIVDKLERAGVLFLYLTGGEILSRPDFKDLYVYIKKKGFMVELLTNGSLIDEEIISLFEVYPPIKLSISIYGSKEDTYDSVTRVKGSFRNFISALKLLKAHNIPFELKTPLIQHNKDEVFEMKKLAESFNASYTYSTNIMPTIHGDTSVMEFALTPKQVVDIELQDEGRIRLMKEIYEKENPYKAEVAQTGECSLYMCGIGQNTFVVDYKGYINGCMKQRQDKFNLLTHSFKESWEYLGHYQKIKTSGSYKCTQCDFYHSCAPCPAESLHIYDKADHPVEAKCKLEELRFEEFSKL